MHKKLQTGKIAWIFEPHFSWNFLLGFITGRGKELWQFCQVHLNHVCNLTKFLFQNWINKLYLVLIFLILSIIPTTKISWNLFSLCWNTKQIRIENLGHQNSFFSRFLKALTWSRRGKKTRFSTFKKKIWIFRLSNVKILRVVNVKTNIFTRFRPFLACPSNPIL